MEQLFLLRRGDAVVVGDGVGQFGEAIFVSLESLVVVRFGIVTELETIQRNAKRAEGQKVGTACELAFFPVYGVACEYLVCVLFTCDTECPQCSCSGRALSSGKLSAHAQS